MKTPLYFVIRLLLLLFLSMPMVNALAAATSESISPETLNAKIKEVEATADLDEQAKSRLTELYRKTLTFLEKAQSNKVTTESYREARKTALEKAETMRKKMEETAKTPADAELKTLDKSAITEIEQQLLKEKADHAAVDAKLTEIERQLAEQAERPTAVREQLSAASQRKETLSGELKAPAPTDELPMVSEARNWMLQSENQALNAEIQMLDQELLSQPMRVELLKAYRDRSAQSLKRIDVRIHLLEEILGGKRIAEAEQAIEEAEQAKLEALGKHPLLQNMAEQNAALSMELASLAAQLEQVTAEVDAMSNDAKRLSEEFRSIKQKLDVAGLSQALGRVLYEQRRALPDPRQFQSKTKESVQAIAAASLNQISHEEEQGKLRNISDYVDGLLAGLPEEEAESIRAELKDLVESRYELLAKAIFTDQALVRALGELDFARRHLMETVESYNEFLAEHLLWIRSAPGPSLQMLLDIPKQLYLLISPRQWLDVLVLLGSQGIRSPVLALGLLLFGALLWKKRQMRDALAATGKKIVRIRTDQFVYTFQALLLTLLMAAPWPLLLATMGWQLSTAPEVTDFAKAVARGLVWTAKAGFYLAAFYILCHSKGLAAAHFHWPKSSLERLRRGILNLMLTFLPAAFVALVLFTLETSYLDGGLGRLAFVIVLIALAFFFYRLFEPNTGVLSSYLAKHPHSMFTRLRYLWLILSVTVPLGLAVLALIGYMYTAGTLTQSLINTMWFILVLVVIQQLVIRWLLLMRRRLAFQAVIERREAARAKEQAEKEIEPGSESPAELIEEPEVDLDALSTDTRELLNVALEITGIIGVWMIWSRLLPAFGFLDEITLWHHVAVVAGESKQVPVTLADGLLAILVIIFTVVATKRLPGLLEIGLLQRLDISSGGRYTVTTLSRYAVVAIGILFAFNTIGASWSQLQWLVAALGVGIGFGLQEIVANFISGLIILFERPIRVGDTVTIGDTDGVVTRIRIRATTIRNWDGKELLVPNKEFITARLLNWTLSDSLTRIVIPVGLVYGGDVEKAMMLLLQAAEEHHRVLADPRPTVVFDQFGDNALSLKLRCFIDSMDYRFETISELHQAINHKFKENSLVIAFPQRDVHLNTLGPLEVRIHADEPKPDAGEKS